MADLPTPARPFQPQKAGTDSPETPPSVVYFRWIVGLLLMLLSLFVSAGMGIYQEQLTQKYGKHPFEALFYTHLLPIPMFLCFGGNIWEHSKVALDSELLSFFGLCVPSMIVYLSANVLTNYSCISSVYVLTTECPSLTVTLIVTLRKFLSIVFSVLYFRNEFTVTHWIGTCCVFLGTLIFTDIPSRVHDAVAAKWRSRAIDVKG